MNSISVETLLELYEKQTKSAAFIAQTLKCSESKVNYWLKKYQIKKRSISEAVYIKSNPQGDPFKIKKPENINEAILLGIGLGLYWGEGTKSNKHSIRLGNTDPTLIKKFIEFLIVIYGIKKEKLRFGLQIFSDLSAEEVVNFWANELKISKEVFYKIVVTPSGSIGTYKNKSKYGVLTVYYSNKKLRDILCNAIENIKNL